MYEALVPENLQKALAHEKDKSTRSKWTIGDLANTLWRFIKDEGIEAHDFQIWNAAGFFCDMSGERVKKLAAISEAFSPELREEFGEWGYGYFERVYDLPAPMSIIDSDGVITMVSDERRDALEFLSWYLYEQPDEVKRRKLPINEFMLIFRQHILGKDVTDTPQDNGVLETSVYEEEPSVVSKKGKENPFTALETAIKDVLTALELWGPRSYIIRKFIGDLIDAEDQIQSVIDIILEDSEFLDNGPEKE